MAIFATIRALTMGNTREWLARALSIVVLGLLFFIALGGVSHRTEWHINTTEIRGAVIVSSDDIRALVQQELLGNYFFSYARDNSFLFPQREIERSLLEKFPLLKTVVAERIDTHTIRVSVTERKLYALWCGEEYQPNAKIPAQCFLIDDSGYIFDRAPIFSEGVYLEFYGALTRKDPNNAIGGVLSASRFARTNELIGVLEDGLGDPLRIILGSDGEYQIVMHSSRLYPALAGASLRLKDDMVPAAIMKNLLASLRTEFPGGAPHKKKLLYVDMRFDKQIIFGFEN